MLQRTCLVRCNGSSQRTSLGGNFVSDNNWFLTTAEIIDCFFPWPTDGEGTNKVSKKHADWGPETGDIINSTHSILYPIFFMSLVVIFFPPIKQWVLGFYQFWLRSRCFMRNTRQNWGQDCGVQFCSASRSLHPTAVMSAAPFPLPSSDSRKVTSQLGARSLTVWCMILEKLWKETRAVGEEGPAAPVEWSTAMGICTASPFTMVRTKILETRVDLKPGRSRS